MSDVNLPDPPEGYFWRVKWNTSSTAWPYVLQLRRELWWGLSWAEFSAWCDKNLDGTARGMLDSHRRKYSRKTRQQELAKRLGDYGRKKR